MQLQRLLSVSLCYGVVAQALDCHADNCLRALQRGDGADSAYSFCKTFTTKVVTATTALPSFATQCSGNTVSRVSSACSCFVATYIPPATGSVTTTSSQPTSTIATSTSTLTTSITSSTSATTSSAPTCTPSFTLDGVSEKAFNAVNTPFSFKLSCNFLNTSSYVVFINSDASTDPFGSLVQDTTNTSSSITFASGFGSGVGTLTVSAQDTLGNSIFQSFTLIFGDITMPVLVLDETGAPVVGQLVSADATVYPGVQQNATTGNNGVATFSNIFSTSIGLLAKTADNKIGVNGIAATTSTVTLQLLAFQPASTTTDFGISNGTTGWTGGVNQDLPVTKRDTVLVVATNGQPHLQLAHAEPKVYPFTSSVYIKYKFQTNEVPGGYFGTQYNDYYVVSIRSDTGETIAVSHSMNELGLGSFDSTGATNWFTLTLPLPSHANTTWVEFDVGVSNVVDSLFDSQIIVDKAGDLTCDECGSCSTCPGDPMCQPTCIDPPLKSCAFYADCAEATLQCGPDSYPLNYGQKNCLRFQADLPKYTSAGQDFIWGTMHCLQVALRDAINCDSTCDQASNAAFDSHPKCYVDNGFCALEPEDWLQVVKTVNTDLLGLKAIEQVLQTSATCAGDILSAFEAKIQYYLDQAAQDAENKLLDLAKAAALSILKGLVDSLQKGTYPVPNI